MCRLSSRVMSSRIRAQQRMVASRRMPSKMFIAKLSRKNCSVAMSSSGIVHRQQRVEHHLGARVDVLDLLVHRVDEAAIREMVPRLVHRLRGRMIAVVFLAEREHQPGAHVLRHALANLQDVQHATERAAGRVGLHVLGKRLERRRLAVRGPGMGHERIVALDRHAPVDVVLEVPVGRVRLGEERVDARMAGVVELQEFARPHRVPRSPTDTPRAVAMPPAPLLPVQVDRDRQGGVAPLLELVPGTVLLVDQPSRERLLRLALDDARPAGESPPADLDVHGRIGAQIAHPVGVLATAGEEIDAGAPVVGGCEPDSMR